MESFLPIVKQLLPGFFYRVNVWSHALNSHCHHPDYSSCPHRSRWIIHWTDFDGALEAALRNVRAESQKTSR